ncbi:MAG: hypothetical protein AAGC63_12625 [Propionicimonas sp.]|nr:hypothetical protein [Propionicimonas sp.]
MARNIRFMFDWGHQWPLWESGSDKYAMEPSDYGLSAELAERLRAVYDAWLEHWDRGWDSPEALAAWTSDRRQALAILRREVADFADVEDV